VQENYSKKKILNETDAYLDQEIRIQDKKKG